MPVPHRSTEPGRPRHRRAPDALVDFHTGDDIACRTVSVKLHSRDPFKATVTTTGEKFDLEKHPQGTEVKAITYSAMQIHEKEDRCDLYVIVDI